MENGAASSRHRSCANSATIIAASNVRKKHQTGLPQQRPDGSHPLLGKNPKRKCGLAPNPNLNPSNPVSTVSVPSFPKFQTYPVLLFLLPPLPRIRILTPLPNPLMSYVTKVPRSAIRPPPDTALLSAPLSNTFYPLPHLLARFCFASSSPSLPLP